jgi:hypothetical protein
MFQSKFTREGYLLHCTGNMLNFRFRSSMDSTSHYLARYFITVSVEKEYAQGIVSDIIRLWSFASVRSSSLPTSVLKFLRC